MTGQVVSVSQDQAVQLLAEAFAEDPAFAYFTQGLAPHVRKVVHPRLVRWIVRFHHMSGQPIRGWQVDGRIIACALVEHHPSLLRRGLALLRQIPGALRLPLSVLVRLNRYAVLSAQGRPAGVTHFLVLLGVADPARGQGHGARFLHALHRQSGPAAHWALDTENPANPSFYARSGYQHYATEPLGTIQMFKLHRPSTVMPPDEDQP